MGILKLIAAATALTLAVPATAATTIDFDHLPGSTALLPTSGTTISTQYASLGVTFLGTNTLTNVTGPLNSWGEIAATGPGGSRNSLISVGAIPPGGSSNYLLAPRYDLMSVLFTNVASDISFGLYTGGGQNTVNITAYNAAGGVVQALTNVRANEGRFDLFTLTAADVARIDIAGGSFAPGSFHITSIDNLTFTAAVAGVPEPATWAMMILGFGMAGAALRRRKMRTTVTYA